MADKKTSTRPKKRRQPPTGSGYLSHAAQRTAEVAKPLTKQDEARVQRLVLLWTSTLARRTELLAAIAEQRKRISVRGSGPERALAALDGALARYAKKRDVLEGLERAVERPKWLDGARKIRVLEDLFTLQAVEAEGLQDAPQVFALRPEHGEFARYVEAAATIIGRTPSELRTALLDDDVQAAFKLKGARQATLLCAARLLGGSTRNLHRYLSRLEDYEFTHSVRFGLSEWGLPVPPFR